MVCSYCRRGVGHLLFWVGGLLAPARAAQAQAPDSLAAIGQRLQRYQQQVLTEKLYGHLDRPAYTVGETMWLKLYAVEGHSHRPLALSKVAYVEVLNQAQQPVLRTSLALHHATGHGSLDLPLSLPSGRYLVRAYTSWMQNFDPAFYFQAPVTIVNTYQAAEPKPASTAAGYDVQFFPEGGSLVQGLTSKVAFRVAGATGGGLAAMGTIRNQRGAVVATFRTLKFGLGSFMLTPAAGATYVAEVTLPDGTHTTAPLPAVQARGYALRLQDAGPTQLRISAATQEVGAAGTMLTLVGHSGGQVITTQTLYASAQQEATFLVSKQLLRAGISHFTLFNSLRQPVCERLYFRRPPSLALTATVAKAQYGPREKVMLRLALPQATAANASLAVYQLDSLTTSTALADINSVLSLTSDLKGTVENPGYYLRDSTQTGQEAADNLMLTHGWSRFQWPEILGGQPPVLSRVPELSGPLVRGQIRTATGAPAVGIRAYLAWPDRVAQFYSAVSDAQGTVQFEVKNLYGPHKLILQTDWRRDSTYQLALASPYSTRYAAPVLKPLVLSPSMLSALTQHHIQTQVQQAYFGQYRQYGLPAYDTVAVYGVPTEHYALDGYTRFKSMEDVMREYVQGVAVRQGRDGLRFLLMDTPHHMIFREAPLTLLDGVPIFEAKQLTDFDPLRVQRLGIVTHQYYYGSQAYNGVISYATYKHDLGGYQLSTKALLETYEGLQGQREFFAPRYDSPQQSPLADLRSLLYWNPELTISPGQNQSVEFYTSDQIGRYLVVVQGLADNGVAGSTATLLEVKAAL